MPSIPVFRQGKFFITSIGCIESNLSGSLYFNYFQQNNWSPAEKPEDADLVVCVTCGVTNVKTRQSLRSIKHLEKKLKPHSFIVVAGCVPKIVGEELKAKLGAKTIIAPSPQDVESLIVREIPLDQVQANFVRYKYMRMRMKMMLAVRKIVFALEETRFPLPAYLSRVVDAYEDPRWYYVSIGHGCLHQCAFCAIKLAKGNIKSRLPEMILREIQAGLETGHTKFVLSGDDIGAWGQDIDSDFIELLKAISNLDGDFQIYIRNLEPFWLLRYFDKFFEVVKMRKIRAITVPIQSGNDEVLRAMKRGHKIAPLREIFHRLTTETPYILILTHFMVGLPGEDAKAFKDSLKVIREVRFEGIAPDRFFAQPNTPAFTMDKQVPYLVKWWRYLVLFADIIWSVYFNRGNLKGLR